MAHQQQRDFFQSVKTRFPSLFNNVTVLEIGSLDINGTIRDLFNAKQYIGVDVQEGPGVDVVAEGQLLDYKDKSFDTVISAECFEHNPYWAETFVNMARMAKKAVIFSCASTGRPEHGTRRTTPEDSPYTLDWDYYRNLEAKDFEQKVDLSEYFSEWHFEYNPESQDLYFYGFKA